MITHKIDTQGICMLPQAVGPAAIDRLRAQCNDRLLIADDGRNARSSRGLVRGLFFDKPPDRTWSLPWHKDTAIAVDDNSIPSPHFSRPTVKAGVPHVVASDDILRRMLTLRIHSRSKRSKNDCKPHGFRLGHSTTM